MANMPTFLKKGDGNSIVFTGKGHLTFFVPESFFTKKFASVDAEYIKLFGIFNYAVYDENQKPTMGLKLFKFPSVFICKPTRIVKEKGLKLTANSPVEDYRLLIFEKDDKVMVSTKVPKLVDNVETFFRMFTSGALPSGIPYDELHELFLENCAINGYNYGVPQSLIGIIVSEICRSKSDHSKPFRHTKITDMKAYDTISIKEIPNITSPYTAITSENWDESMANAVTNKDHKYSPMEKLFMG